MNRLQDCGDLSDAEFRTMMCQHMEKQTDFLEGIYKAVEVLVTIGNFIKYMTGLLLGTFGLWEIFKTYLKH